MRPVSGTAESGSTDRRYPIHHKPRRSTIHMSIARTLVAALAVTALAVPAAQARPEMPVSVAKAAPKEQQLQDFRTINGRDTARSIATAAAKGQQAQDFRAINGRDVPAPASTRHHTVNAPGATAVDSATRTAPRTFAGPPTWP